VTIYLDVAEAAWRWVLDQVRWDDGPFIPESPDEPMNPRYRDGMNSGTGGLALALAEIRAARSWTAEERRLADAIAERERARIPAEVDCTYFDGLVSSIGVLDALDAPGVDAAVDRLLALAGPDGWPQTAIGPPRAVPGARVSDLVLGTAGVLLGALWARRAGAANADELAERAARVLMAEVEDVPTGANWRFLPLRFRATPPVEMPNFSHGLAGIATTLALAGTELDRPDLLAAACRGAAHLVTLGDTSGDGFAVPHRIPAVDDRDDEEFAYGWCHGPTGTSLLFVALDRAGVTGVAGAPPLAWQRRCLHRVRTSGLPARLRPGFWDNDGRCCGTAGVADAFLDSAQRRGDPADLGFALRLADVLVERAVRDGPHAYWRFIEHRAAEPLLAPGVGWQQGAAGIAAVLFRAARVAGDGAAAAVVPRMDSWWASC
jgi:hypothetical protein